MACKFRTLLPETWLRKEDWGGGRREREIREKHQEETGSRKGFVYFQRGDPGLDYVLRGKASREPG